MKINKLTVIPPLLVDISPKVEQLYTAGEDLDILLQKPRIAIVGSRKPTAYGKQVTEQLAAELAKNGVVIISGLALGIDAISHQAALEAGGQAIAVLPGPLTDIVPARNQSLATRILAQGGALVSEYAPDETIYKYNFVARNRIMAGLADGVLVTEAAVKSGSLHTAEFAVEQGRDVFAVPGNITSPASAGTNNLIKTGHAAAVTSAKDILQQLGIVQGAAVAKITGGTPEEQKIIDLLYAGILDGDELLQKSALGASAFNQSLIMLEITGKIRALGANTWCLS